MKNKKDKYLKQVSSRPDFVEIENQVLKFWENENIFEKSVKQRSKDEPYTFYDGPPFVTGYPHYGHLIGSIAKDIIPRFFTMKGKRVRRVWGWDCHGLPIENKVEEKLGLKNRKEIEKYGIDRFIKECKQYVEEVSSEWKWYIDHIGRWVDMENAYRTMNLEYMESVIWAFKQLYDKGLIYKGARTSLYCTRCGTPVSNFEIAMDNSYKEMEDPAVTVKFKIDNPQKIDKKYQNKKIYLLAWTTTPWTLPSNRALVVDPKEKYIVFKISSKKERYILAEKRVKQTLKKKEYEELDKLKGDKLIGLSYQAPYDFFAPNEKDFKVYSYPEMVNMEEGTGIVHSAPGFGDIDTEMGQDIGLTVMFSVDEEGKFVEEVKNWQGIYVKKADPLIIKDLQKRDLLFKNEKIVHRCAYCYRCETPLIHKAQHSWFINVQKIKKQLLKTNKKINWVPNHFKEGRFKKGIQQAPDWCISRTRYWATVMPVWECDQCGQRKVFGSVKEIEKATGQKVTGLHRDGVDSLVFNCDECGGEMRRIPEVLDCWMESGSMPYGERHYPFENKKDFERSFPGDYIVEYTGQVRAWFYVMHVISNALKESHCFKNVVVTGVMAGTDGRKMSKSYGNYPDPRKILKKYGGDALRLYLMSSPVMMGEHVKMTKGKEIEDQVKKVLLILWNCYRYLTTYCRIHKHSLKELSEDFKPQKQENLLDRWIISKVHLFIQNFSSNLKEYKIPDAVNLIQPFVDQLSTWYIRRSRKRFFNNDLDAFRTLYYVLKKFLLASAPAIPFVTEKIYQGLRLEQEQLSVHLSDYPEFDQSLIDKTLLNKMEQVQQIVSEGHSDRKKSGIKLRQPLSKVTVKLKQKKDFGNSFIQLIKDELNVKRVDFKEAKKFKVFVDKKITKELKEEGWARDIVRKIQNARKKAGCNPDQKVSVVLKDWPEKFEKEIKKKTLTKEIKRGKELKIK